jgi:ATP-binding cassette, subfamily B, fatty acid transporter
MTASKGRWQRYIRRRRAGDGGRALIRLYARLGPQRRLVAVVIVMSLAGSVFEALGPRVLAHATDLVVGGQAGHGLAGNLSKDQALATGAHGDDMWAGWLPRTHATQGGGIDVAAVGRTLLLGLGVYGVAALCIWLQARVLARVIRRTVMALRTDIEDKVHRLPLSYIDSCQRGELLGRVTADVVNVEGALNMAVSMLPTAVFTIGAVSAMMLTLSPLLALITALTVPLGVLLSQAILRRARRFSLAAASVTGRLNAHIEEIYSGIELVQVFGQSPRTAQQFDAHNAELHRVGVRGQFVSGLILPATAFVGNLGYVAVALIGGLLMATGQLTLGGIQAFIQYVRQFNQPMSVIAAMGTTLLTGLSSAHRVFDLLDAPEQASDTARGLRSHAGSTLDGDGHILQVTSGRVEFERVTFGYRPDVPVIKDLSLVAEPGSTVAIVGPTGAGKTTLVNLLMRFYDVDAGRILLDGRDIATIDQRVLRARIGMVLQDTWLFVGTVADNIGYGRPGAGREEIIQAAAAANVDHFVRALPDGYDTIIDDQGCNLSAGQKQLITIARAFLMHPQLLILDEATSSVDTRTEVLIQHAMAELRRARTCFVIAHRLSTIRDADTIVVMDAGRIVEHGNHTDLVAKQGAYHAMIQTAAPKR